MEWQNLEWNAAAHGITEFGIEAHNRTFVDTIQIIHGNHAEEIKNPEQPSHPFRIVNMHNNNNSNSNSNNNNGNNVLS